MRGLETLFYSYMFSLEFDAKRSLVTRIVSYAKVPNNLKYSNSETSSSAQTSDMQNHKLPSAPLCSC